MSPSPHAVVLLSGGLDSAVTTALLLQDVTVHALTVDYGQRHGIEVEGARAVAAHYAIDHRIVRVDLRAIGGSALTDSITVPKDRDVNAPIIPATYVPARNTILLGLALAWSEVLDADQIAIGINAVDYSGYPDCRPEYLSAFGHLARLATRRGVERHAAPQIVAPLSGMSKADIIRRGASLGVPFALTHSCYDPVRDQACGRCDSCRIRREGFDAAGVPDPTRYAEARRPVRALSRPQGGA